MWPPGPTNAHALWLWQFGDAGEPRAALSAHLGTGGTAVPGTALGLSDTLQPPPQHTLGGGGSRVQPSPHAPSANTLPASMRHRLDSDPNPNPAREAGSHDS